MEKAQTLKGFRDLFGKTEAIRGRVVATLKTVFERYGFEPLETPTLEYADVLLGKYGDEADKLVYTFDDRGGRKVGLRYDLTVPFARVLAQYQTLSKPFKRYQIQSAFRAENPQKSRYREFTQCDIDIAGSASPIADAEIIAVIYDSLKSLPFPEFSIKVNSRQILFAVLSDAKIPEKDFRRVLGSIDKVDKIGKEAVQKELADKGISITSIEAIFSSLEKQVPDQNLTTVIDLAQKLGVEKGVLKFDPTMVRGLDYYTGPIFETVVEKPKIGSLTGGGRYDDLIKSLGGPDIPATGTTIGLDRIVDVIEELKLWPDMTPTPSEVLVTVFSPDLANVSSEIAAKLRKQNINTELYLNPTDKFDKQLKYADRKSIPYVVIIGPDEVSKKVVTLKDLKTRTQFTVAQEKLAESLALALRNGKQ